jgi:hypothetical protein
MELDETSEGIDSPLLNYVKTSQEYIRSLEAQIQRFEKLNESSQNYIKSLETHNKYLEGKLTKSKGFWKRWLGK